MGVKNWLSNTSSGFGTFFSIGCPACVPAIGGIFSAIGLGFIINMTLLKPITAILLLIGLFGLYGNYKKHKYKTFFVIGAVASFAIFASRYVVEFQPTLYAGAGILFLNAIFDYKYAKKCGCCEIKKN